MDENSSRSERAGVMGCGIVMALVYIPLATALLAPFMWLILCCVGWSNLTWKGLFATWLGLISVYAFFVVFGILREMINI